MPPLSASLPFEAGSIFFTQAGAAAMLKVTGDGAGFSGGTARSALAGIVTRQTAPNMREKWGRKREDKSEGNSRMPWKNQPT
jgi:hypothetical protein